MRAKGYGRESSSYSLTDAQESASDFLRGRLYVLIHEILVFSAYFSILTIDEQCEKSWNVERLHILIPTLFYTLT